MHLNKSDTLTSMDMANISASGASGAGSDSPRRHRYTRASTTSVGQLLSDGYSSIISRLTRRQPSEKHDTVADGKLSAARARYDDKGLAGIRRYETSRQYSPYSTTAAARILNEDRLYSSYLSSPKSRLDSTALGALSRSDSFRSPHLKDNKASPLTKRYPLKEANNNIDTTIQIGSSLGSTRSRLEDKYSSVLDRIALQKKERARKEKEDRDKTLEPESSMPRGLMRSLTTAVFGEKSFNLSNYGREKTRDKTPYRSTVDRRLSSHHKPAEKVDVKNGLDLSYKDRPYSGKDRDSIYRRHQRRSLRADKSETTDKKGKLALRPVDINLAPSGVRDLVSPLGAIETNSKSKLTKTPATTPVREIGRQRQIYFPSSDEEDDDKTPTGDPILSERENRRKEIQSLIMKYAHVDEGYGRLDKEVKNGDVKPAKVEPLGVGDVVTLPPELRGRQRPVRPRHLTRRAATPPVSSLTASLLTVCR